MAQTVWKTVLDADGRNILALPKGSEPLRVDLQGMQLCLWYLVDPNEMENSYYDVEIVGTGTPMNMRKDEANYLNTFMANSYVFHVFWRK